MKRLSNVHKMAFLCLSVHICAIPSFSAASPLTFGVCLNKKVYLVGEPIIVSLQLKNVSDEAVTVAEPWVLYHFVRLEVLDAEGKEPNSPKRKWLVGVLAKDYGVALQPGSQILRHWSLTEIYSFGIPPGKYTLKAVYDTTTRVARYRSLICAKIESKPVAFEVVEPEGQDCQAMLIWQDAMRELAHCGPKDTQRYSKIIAALTQLLTKHKTSAYARYAGYYCGEATWRIQDFGKVPDSLRGFLATYSSTLFYGESARNLVAHAYYHLGRYDEALSQFRLMPDSYNKSVWIEKCREKLSSKD